MEKAAKEKVSLNSSEYVNDEKQGKIQFHNNLNSLSVRIFNLRFLTQTSIGQEAYFRYLFHHIYVKFLIV